MARFTLSPPVTKYFSCNVASHVSVQRGPSFRYTRLQMLTIPHATTYYPTNVPPDTGNMHVAAGQHAHQAPPGTGIPESQSWPALAQRQKRWAPKARTGCLTCRWVIPESINGRLITLFNVKRAHVIGDDASNATRPNLFAIDALYLQITVSATMLLIILSQPLRHLFLARNRHCAMQTTELLASYCIF